MTIVDPVRAPLEDARVNYVQWGPAIAGAFTATAVALVLDSFGAAIGLAVTSTAPTWRDSSAALQLLSGLYLLLVAIAAFGAGGYLAGRMRTPVPGNPDEVEFRDGTLSRKRLRHSPGRERGQDHGDRPRHHATISIAFFARSDVRKTRTSDMPAPRPAAFC